MLMVTLIGLGWIWRTDIPAVSLGPHTAQGTVTAMENSTYRGSFYWVTIDNTRYMVPAAWYRTLHSRMQVTFTHDPQRVYAFDIRGAGITPTGWMLLIFMGAPLWLTLMLGLMSAFHLRSRPQHSL